MIKKITGLLFVGLLCGNLFAAEGSRGPQRKRSASLSFEQQDTRAPFLRTERDPFLPSFTNDDDDEAVTPLENMENFASRIGAFEDLYRAPALFDISEFNEEEEEYIDITESTSLDYSIEELTPAERVLPSLTNSNALRIFYKYCGKKDEASIRKCVDLFRNGKLGINDYFLSHSKDQELPLFKVMGNKELLNELLKIGANPHKIFEYNCSHSVGGFIYWISPLSFACICDDRNGAAKLYALKGCNFNFVDHDGLIPLHYLIQTCMAERTAYILATGAISISAARALGDLELYIDQSCLTAADRKLHKDLISVVEKQQNGTFTQEDAIHYKDAVKLLEEQKQEVKKDKIVAQHGSLFSYIRNRACGIKKGRR